MSVDAWIVIAIILFSVVFISMFNVLVLSYIAFAERSYRKLSRVVYPLSIVAVCGLELDRVQYKLTGVNGIDNALLIAVVALVLVATVLRAVTIIDGKDE